MPGKSSISDVARKSLSRPGNFDREISFVRKFLSDGKSLSVRNFFRSGVLSCLGPEISLGLGNLAS